LTSTTWRTRARGSEGALALSCRAPHGDDQISGDLFFTFFSCYSTCGGRKSAILRLATVEAQVSVSPTCSGCKAKEWKKKVEKRKNNNFHLTKLKGKFDMRWPQVKNWGKISTKQRTQTQNQTIFTHPQKDEKIDLWKPQVPPTRGDFLLPPSRGETLCLSCMFFLILPRLIPSSLSLFFRPAAAASRFSKYF